MAHPHTGPLEFRWRRPEHSRWLLACVAALLFSTLAGGFSFAVVALFVVIFLVGFALLSLDHPDDEQAGQDEAHEAAVDYPEDGEADGADAEGEAASIRDDSVNATPETSG